MSENTLVIKSVKRSQISEIIEFKLYADTTVEKVVISQVAATCEVYDKTDYIELVKNAKNLVKHREVTVLPNDTYKVKILSKRPGGKYVPYNSSGKYITRGRRYLVADFYDCNGQLVYSDRYMVPPNLTEYQQRKKRRRDTGEKLEILKRVCIEAATWEEFNKKYCGQMLIT